MTKYSSGWGGLVGICSVLLAKQGFTGISSVVDFTESTLPGFNQDFEIKNVYFKPYPCCRWMHPVIEGTLDLLNRYEELKPENIKRIQVNTFKAASHLKEYNPRTIESAQYSIPFMTGMAVVHRSFGHEMLKESRLSDENILNIAKKVNIVYSDELEKLFPKQIPTEVEIESVTGNTYQIKVITPKGDPNNPIDAAELSNKFKNLALQCIDESNAHNLIAAIAAIDEIEDVNELTDILKFSFKKTS
jgi:2-methylcitrate dehydratase PrpD